MRAFNFDGWAVAIVMVMPAVWVEGSEPGRSEFEVVAAGLEGLSDLELDGRFAYVTNRESGTLVRIDTVDGTAETLARGQTRIQRLAIDARYVYWVQGEAILRMPKDGGKAIVLARQALRGTRGASGITVDSTSARDGGKVYWSNYFDEVGAIMCVPKAGGEVVRLAANQDGAFGLAVDGTHIYWTNHSGPGKTVMRVAMGGGAATAIARGQYNPTSIACDALAVYWTNLKGGDGAVMRYVKGGGETSVLADGQDGPSEIALDGTCVYWTDLTIGRDRWASRSSIRYLPKRGGRVESLAEDAGHVWGLAVDVEFVYWTNYRLGTLCRARKP